MNELVGGEASADGFTGVGLHHAGGVEATNPLADVMMNDRVGTVADELLMAVRADGSVECAVECVASDACAGIAGGGAARTLGRKTHLLLGVFQPLRLRHPETTRTAKGTALARMLIKVPPDRPLQTVFTGSIV